MDRNAIITAINGLREERRQKASRLAELEDFFNRNRIQVDHEVVEPQSLNNQQNGRDKDETHKEFVLRLLRENGRMSTAEINEVWKQSSRPWDANVTLLSLYREGKVSRRSIRGSRGSYYRLKR